MPSFVISDQQFTHFRKEGEIAFHPSPFPFSLIEEAQSRAPSSRDLWRTFPPLRKGIEKILLPFALELSKKPSLRLLTDAWEEMSPPQQTMGELFGFQGISLFALCTPETLSFYEPSSLCVKIPPHSYLLCLGIQHSRFVKHPNDPHQGFIKELGYTYGDLLKNQTHPLFFQN